MNRRELMQAFGAVVSACSCSPAFGRIESHGCILSLTQTMKFSAETKILEKCGIDLIDATVRREAEILGGLFMARPRVAFYDDSAGPNAFAMSSLLTEHNNPGTVCLGVELLKSELTKPWAMAAVTGIVAHVWAHFALFNYVGGGTLRRELHADFMAGWYVGRRALTGTGVAMDDLALSLFSKSNYGFNDVLQHGARQSRFMAMSRGYDNARSTPTVEQAAALGKDVVGARF